MDQQVTFTLLGMAFCLLAEAFFSGSEIGVVSADRSRLHHDAAKGSKGAKMALQMLQKPEWLLSTTLVGTNIAVVTNTTLATALMVDLFGASYSWLAVVFVAPLIWLFGEIIPKSVFQQKANELTPKSIYILKLCYYLFFPILLVFSMITKLLTKLIAGNKTASIFTLREQIISMLHLSGPEGSVTADQGKMIRQMFKFSETTAVQVMIPLARVIGVDKTATCGTARKVALDSGHRNLVVYDQRVDNIVGMIHSLELLGLDDAEPVEPHIKPVRYIGSAKSARELLDDLRNSFDSMAVVVNEFGGATGIVTAADIMQLIVFEFGDEYNPLDDTSAQIKKISDKEYLVKSDIELEYLNDKLGIAVSAGDYSTLAGYLLKKSPDVPQQGSQIVSHDITYTIDKGSDRAIELVRIELP